MHAEDSQAIDAMIQVERDAIMAMIDERLVPLLLRRAMSRLVREAAHGPVGCPATPLAESARRGMDGGGSFAPRHRSRVAQVVLDRLWTAPDMRLTGMTLNAAVTGAGYGLDAAQKVKTRMRRAGILRHETFKGQSTWVLAEEYRRSDAVLPGSNHDADG